MTDQELNDGDLNGTLTNEQMVEYLIRIEKCLPSTAHMIVYTDWDRLEKDKWAGHRVSDKHAIGQLATFAKRMATLFGQLLKHKG